MLKILREVTVLAKVNEFLNSAVDLFFSLIHKSFSASGKYVPSTLHLRDEEAHFNAAQYIKVL